MDHPSIIQAKVDLRARVRTAVIALGEAARRDASARICDAIASSPAFARARTVAAYWALPGEPEVRELIERALADGKRVCLPRVRGEAVELVRIDEAAETAMHRSELGVLEPAGGMVVPVDAVDLLVIPGVAFDAGGGRLGRGRGFFDRLLGGHGADCPVCGVCYGAAMVESVPMEAHDVRVDAVATEGGIGGFREENRGLWRT